MKPSGDEKSLTRERVIEMLRQRALTVVFTKKSTGEERRLVCTLREDLLPRREVTGDDARQRRPRKVNTETVAAFDLEKNAWRSFRLDSIKEII